MKPVNFLDDAPVAAASAARPAASATGAAAATRAADLARSARPGAGAVGAARTGAAAASGGGKPPPPKRDAVTGEPPTSEDIPKAPSRPAETVEDLRAAQRKTREANTFSLPFVEGRVPQFLARQNQPGRTFAQAVADLSRADLPGMATEMVLGPDRYDKLRATIEDFRPDILTGGLPAGVEKRNIAGRDVVVYPRYAALRADDRGPAREVRLAREAPTPAQFGARRDALRKAFETAKKDYKDSVGAADRTSMAGTATDKEVEDAALIARKRLQKVVDLREALRELQEPEDKLGIN